MFNSYEEALNVLFHCVKKSTVFRMQTSQTCVSKIKVACYLAGLLLVCGTLAENPSGGILYPRPSQVTIVLKKCLW